jgi:hypothetical protein
VWLLCSLTVGCAFGDGQGFATVQGALRFEIGQVATISDAGQAIELDALKINLAFLKLEGTSLLNESFLESRQSIMPVPGEWDLVQGSLPSSFGPYEVIGGAYQELVVVIRRLVLEGTVDGNEFRLEIAPEDGIEFRAVADLPADREHPPVITIAARAIFPETLLNGVDLLGDPELARSQIMANIASDGILDANWTRKSD